jgi:hypothetical protein
MRSLQEWHLAARYWRAPTMMLSCLRYRSHYNRNCQGSRKLSQPRVTHLNRTLRERALFCSGTDSSAALRVHNHNIAVLMHMHICPPAPAITCESRSAVLRAAGAPARATPSIPSPSTPISPNTPMVPAAAENGQRRGAAETLGPCARRRFDRSVQAAAGSGGATTLATQAPPPSVTCALTPTPVRARARARTTPPHHTASSLPLPTAGLFLAATSPVSVEDSAASNLIYACRPWCRLCVQLQCPVVYPAAATYRESVLA